MSGNEEAKIISIDVKCPWCGAEPGERCTESDMHSLEGWRYLPHNRGHLGRTRTVRMQDDA